MWERKYEDSSADLAFRIIEKAKHVQQKQNMYREKVSVFDAVNGFWGRFAGKFNFSGFYVPAPAYVVPLVFLLGFFVNRMIYPSVTLGDFVDEMYMVF